MSNSAGLEATTAVTLLPIVQQVCDELREPVRTALNAHRSGAKLANAPLAVPLELGKDKSPWPNQRVYALLHMPREGYEHIEVWLLAPLDPPSFIQVGFESRQPTIKHIYDVHSFELPLAVSQWRRYYLPALKRPA